MKVVYFKKTITVAASSGNASSFKTLLSNTYSNSITESVQLRLQYEQFKSSLSSSELSTAASMILDGLQKDGLAQESNQDEQTILTIAQTLDVISTDFTAINSTSIVSRSFDIFKKIVVTENDQISTSSLYRSFSQEAVANLFNYADKLLSSLSMVDSSLQTTIKQTVQRGFEYVIRGSMVDQAPGDSAFTLTGTNIAIMSSKLTSTGFVGNQTVSGTAAMRRSLASAINVSIPSSAMTSKNYIQTIIISTKDPAYLFSTKHSEGVIKSPMVRVSLQEVDSLLATITDRSYSRQLSLANLSEPIQIEIPFSGTIGEKNTLMCGYTKSPGDTLKIDGVTTVIQANS